MALFGKKKPDGHAEDTRPNDAQTRASSQTDALGRSSSRATEPNQKTEQPRKGKDGSTLSSGEITVGSIGKSIVVKGELTGNEDVEIDGTVEGDIRLTDNVVTIGPNGRVSGSVHAKTVQILGNVKGDVGAGERIEIEASGVVEGDLRAPRLLVQEGAVVNGSIEMTSGGAGRAKLTSDGDKSEQTVQAV